MFARDQRLIATYAQSSPARMARVYRFVLATIQQPLETTPEIVADFERRGVKSKWAFSSKKTGLAWIKRNEQALYDGAMQAAQGDDVELLSYFAALPGIGLVKGGFMCQLIFGRVGCLDVHNIRMMGLTASRFSAHRFKSAKRDETRKAIAEEYLRTIQDCGGCESLWDGWCDYVATLRPKVWVDGDAVSAAHWEIISKLTVDNRQLSAA